MLVPARKLLLVFVLSLIAAPVTAAVFLELFSPANEFWGLGVIGALFSLYLMAGLAYLVLRYQVDLEALFGSVSWRELLPILPVAVPLSILSFGTIYLLHYPLSFIAPRFVEFWVLDDPSPYYVYEDGSFPFLINAFMFLLIVIVGPLTEEIFFRGFLFRRMARKFSLRWGLLVSSGLFAIPHTDILGAFCFGAVMAILYKVKGSLWVPVAVHAFGNLLASILLFIPSETPTVLTSESIADFRSGWPSGVVGLLVGGAWLAWFLRKYWPEFTEAPTAARLTTR